jgi:type IX secretion system PorP/SprF family membrane protein
MKKTLILTVLITITGVLRAQFSPQVSHFMYDQLRTNPGSAGNMDMICVNGIIRDQLNKFVGAPKTYLVEVDAPFKLLGLQHGVGIYIYQDKMGFFTNTDFALTYAYRWSLGSGTLGIGLQAGFVKNDLNPTDPGWITSDGQAPSADAGIPTAGPNNAKFHWAAGLFYKTEDLYFGISSVNLNNPEIIAASTSTTGAEAKYKIPRQYYVTAGYTMQLTNPIYELKPAIQLQSDGVATDMDINLTLLYNKSIWGGVTYRTGEAVVGLFGLELSRLVPGLKLGVSYDFLTNSMSKELETYEILLSYSFKIGVEKAPQKYKSIRFL